MDAALTRLEVLAVLTALALLAVVTMPVLAGGKPRSESAICANNLRQLGAATLAYSMETEGRFPRRQLPNSWPQQLFTRYEEPRVLRCPSDPQPSTGLNSPQFPADSAPRSYLMNGWNDYFGTVRPTNAMPESAIPYPAQTILFGEKESSSGHFYMDFLEGAIGNDIGEIEHGRHGARRAAAPSGGSNHAMVDGSVRMMLYGQAVYPTNLWAVTEVWRTNSFGP